MSAGAESQQDRLRRLIAQADAMIAELRNRATTGDLELAQQLEAVRNSLQKRLIKLLSDGE